MREIAAGRSLTPAPPASIPRRLIESLGLKTPARRREAMWGIVFAMPWLLGLLIFVIGPIVASMALSLTKYDVITPPSFVGLSNYVTALTSDDLFW
ncbi:MAG: sugar ABC transporter permease, partial [Chloroflexi bacterium]|nr:sugar ABC transporter permease [Chloroflexota bacterium]